MDYSFLRLKPSLEEALNLGESPAVSMPYYFQVQLVPGETYLQISNSETPIAIVDNYECYLVDTCGNEVIDVTTNMFMAQFTDSNGIIQVVWEFINTFDYGEQILCLRFRNTVNDDTWFTNPFIITAYDQHLTFRFDYKHSRDHYGTQYSRADYRQSIRLKGYYNNPINESERSEYHQVTTDATVPARNIKKIKESYLLETLNDFTSRRLETMLSSSSIYLDCVRTFSTTPLEFVPRLLDSNISVHEMIVNKKHDDTFTFEWQLFEGIQITNHTPFGPYLTGTSFTTYVLEFNIPITLESGDIRLYNSGGLIETYTESVMTVVSNELRIDVTGTTGENPPDESYYLTMDSGLVQGFGVDFGGISDTTEWIFNLGSGDYLGADYNNNDYFTN